MIRCGVDDVAVQPKSQKFANFWDFGCRFANSLPIPRM